LQPIPADGEHFAKHGQAVVKASVSFNQDTASFAKLLDEATAKYGKPKATGTNTAQKGFGARWELRTAAWSSLPDGCSVTLLEEISPNGGLYSLLPIQTADEEKRNHKEDKPNL